MGCQGMKDPNIITGEELDRACREASSHFNQKLPCKTEMTVLGPDDPNKRVIGIRLVETSYPIPLWIGSGPPPEDMKGMFSK